MALTWDPSEPVATRPLAIQISGTWHTYGWDLTKNICELYGTTGYISTTYTYTPFGQVTASGSVTQPIQWSSEVWDSELGLVYYNWRYYNMVMGRWLSYDTFRANQEYNVYIYSKNDIVRSFDLLGNRRAQGTVKDDQLTLGYDFDVFLHKSAGNCLLRFVTSIKIKYEGDGNPVRKRNLYNNVEVYLNNRFSKLDIVLADKPKAKCPCKEIAYELVVVEYGTAAYEKEKLKSKPLEVTYNPNNERSYSNAWKKDSDCEISHEILHLFGVKDEYAQEPYNKKKEDLPIDHNKSIMGMGMFAEGEIYPRHLEQIIDKSKVKDRELKNCNITVTYTA